MNNSEQSLRVLTWNIHRGIGIDFCRDYSRIGNVLKHIDADVVALQELEIRTNTGVPGTISKLLKNQAGKYACHAWTVADESREYGHALFSRHPLEAQKIHDISIPHREPRAIIESIITLPKTRVRVIGIHLGLSISDKVKQLSQLIDIINNKTYLPTIIMGDFNEWWPGQVDKMFTDSFGESTGPRSFPSFFPILSLDRILCSNDINKVKSKSVILDRMASDHLPVMAEVNLSI